MTTAPPAAGNPPTVRLNEELTAVRAELTRLDGKCSTLAGLAGAALAFVVSRTAAHGPLLAKVPLIAAGIALAAAAEVLLIAVLRPRFGPTGFNRYATMTTPQIRTALQISPDDEDHDRAQDLGILSAIARTKNERLRLAVNLVAAAVALITLGMAVSVTLP